MSFDPEAAYTGNSAPIPLVDRAAHSLVEIALDRQDKLDSRTLLKILDVLRNRLSNFYPDNPEYDETERAYLEVQEICIRMLDGAPKKGKALKSLMKSANLNQLRTK